MEWRILVTGREHPYMNMAIDDAIYQGVTNGESPPTIRFYDWEPAAFSCGYNQNFENELDLKMVENSEYLYVRRQTGGRLVLHEDEVTYAVISKLTDTMEGGISDTYLRISKALLAGLKKLGVDADMEREMLSSNEQKQLGNPCFTSSSKYEINYKRKKMIGSAQTRNNLAFLQHGSILREKNQVAVAKYMPSLTEDERLRVASMLERRTISLESILQRKLTFLEVVEKLIEGFQEEWVEETFFFADELLEKERELAVYLEREKYSTDNWNIKKRVIEKKDLT
ncbi:MAG: biotin/lipoate A/B protein ligase family protein [Candidatus Cloacimonadia bacterium]